MHPQDFSAPAPLVLTPGVHLMAKPAGPDCNLRCAYCFYLEKDALFPGVKRPRMTDEVLEAYVRQTAAANLNTPGGLLFSWQGGEPTLMGLLFFAGLWNWSENTLKDKPLPTPCRPTAPC